MKRILALALVCALLFASGCTPTAEVPASPPVSASAPTPAPTPAPAPTPEPVDFHTFAAEVNAARKASITWTDADLEGAPRFELTFPPEQKTAFTDEEIKTLLTNHEGGALTPDAAREDVETLFKLLETTYGAYDYFGGKAVFDPLKEDCLAALDGAETWDKRSLGALLGDILAPVLRDGHFSIGSTAMRERYMEYMYFVPDLYFSDPTGLDMDYVKPTIGPDGAITYWFAALSHNETGLPASAELNGETVSLSWERAGEYQNDGLAYNAKEKEGIPLLCCYTMNSHFGSNRARLEQMAESGAEWGSYPLFLLDLRGNGGGNDWYAMRWFEGLTGQWPQRKMAWWQKNSQLYLADSVKWGNTTQAEADERLGAWTDSGRVDGEWAENDSTILVLTDKGVASSGESMVEFLRTADNVVFVGGPTMGCALVPNEIQFYLPNSGLGLYFGSGLSLAETYENTDGRGYLPDLWVDPPDALDAAVRLVDYYGLNEKE